MLDLSNLELSELFPVPLLKYFWPDSDDLNTALIELILSKEREDPGISTSNVGGWHSKKDFQRWDAQCVHRLLGRIREVGAAMLERTTGSPKPDMDLWTIQAWANINRLGNCNRFHNHLRNSNLWSGVYYLTTGIVETDKVPKAGILFADQHLAKPLHQDELSGSYCVQPEPGLMLLFPSSLAHKVECHQGSANRISVAFNLKNEQFTTINYELEKMGTARPRPA
jgi:uncharacterized protein (TIGR02466 family)